MNLTFRKLRQALDHYDVVYFKNYVEDDTEVEGELYELPNNLILNKRILQVVDLHYVTARVCFEMDKAKALLQNRLSEAMQGNSDLAPIAEVLRPIYEAKLEG
jgi:hypothetical protein